jgi:hypothetical protein
MDISSSSTLNSSPLANLSYTNLALIVSIITIFLIVLILVSAILIKSVFRMSYSNNKYKTSTVAHTHQIKDLNIISNLSRLAKKSDKELKIELELIKDQVNLLEMQMRPVCTQLYQQLHADYLNDLNNDLIYKIYNLSYTNALPVWNFKTYMYNFFFHQHQLPITSATVSQRFNNQSTRNGNKYCSNNFMSSSSMSNSTTNTLLSTTLTPKQQQILNNQQQQQSVYATIKSSSAIKFDTMDGNGNSCGTLMLNQTTSRHQELLLHGSAGEAMLLFDQLLNNKNFLVTFLSQIEKSPNQMSMLEKRNFVGMLTLALRHNLSYLYSILKLILSEHIANSFKTKTHKSLFKPSNSAGDESIAELLLTNWISIFMYTFQRDTQCSLELYRLVQCIKFYLQMAPCDQPGQLALNTLNEDSYLNPCDLLPAHQQFQTIYINLIVNNNSKALFTVALLDCDTIYQAKEKCMDCVFKSNLNLTQFNLIYKPSLGQCELELCLVLIKNDESLQNQQQQQQTTFVALKETEDELMVSNVGTTDSSKSVTPKRLLTLKDYNIQSGSFINLSFREKMQQQQTQAASGTHDDQANHVYMSTLSMSNEYVLYASNSGAVQSSSSSKPIIRSDPPDNSAANTHGKYHLVKPASSNTNTVSSQQSDSAPNVMTSTTKKASKQKKYEKGTSGTVKSQDSAATATVSLIQSSSSSSSSSSPSPTPSTTSSNGTSSTSASASNKTKVLARLLVNKGTLQPFIDQFIETIFANTANLPPTIQHLFAFLDAEIDKNQSLLTNTNSKMNNHSLGEQEKESLSRDWKTQCYFVKYWLSILRRPDYLLDVSTSELLCSNLDCIVQALHDSMDSNATVQSLLYESSTKSSNESSATNRLLFLNDIPKYKQTVDTFFSELKANSQPAISDHELYFYLNEFSKLNHDFNGQTLDATINNQLGLNINGQCQQTRTISGLSGAEIEMSAVQNLTKLYEVYEKFETGINSDLGQQQCSILLPVHHRLVQIKELMSSNGNNQSNMNNNSNTINGLQQNVSFNNCATMNRIYMTQQYQQQQHQAMSMSPMMSQHHMHHGMHMMPPVAPPPPPSNQSNLTQLNNNQNQNNNFF